MADFDLNALSGSANAIDPVSPQTPLFPSGQDAGLLGSGLVGRLDPSPQAITAIDVLLGLSDSSKPEQTSLEDGPRSFLTPLADELAPIYPAVSKLLRAPTVNKAMSTGADFVEEGAQLIDQTLGNGRTLAKASSQSLGRTFAELASAAAARWNDPDNKAHQQLTHRTEAMVDHAKGLSQAVDESEWMATVRRRLDVASGRFGSFLDSVGNELGHMESESKTPEDIALAQATARLKENLIDLRTSPEFANTFSQSFGDSSSGNQWSVAEAEAVVDEFILGESGLELAVISASEMQAEAAYGENTIFVSDAFLTDTRETPEQLVDVLLEEVGHHFDQVLNEVDSAGDEGAIFSRLAQGDTFAVGELAVLRAEDDSAILQVGDRAIAVEHSFRTKRAIEQDDIVAATSPTENVSSGTGFSGSSLQYQPGQAVVYSDLARQWQQQMKNMGWNIAVDGKFGPQSQAIALQFQQQDPALYNDGIVGPQTWAATFGVEEKTASAPPISPNKRAIEDNNVVLPAVPIPSDNVTALTDKQADLEQTKKDLETDISALGTSGGYVTSTLQDELAQVEDELTDVKQTKIETLETSIDALGTSSSSVTRALQAELDALEPEKIAQLEQEEEELTKTIDALGTSGGYVTSTLKDERDQVKDELITFKTEQATELEDSITALGTSSSSVTKALQEELDGLEEALTELTGTTTSDPELGAEPSNSNDHESRLEDTSQTDELLIDKFDRLQSEIQNWQGSDNDPILDQLIQERVDVFSWLVRAYDSDMVIDIKGEIDAGLTYLDAYQLVVTNRSNRISKTLEEVINLLHTDKQNGWTPWTDGDREVTVEEVSKVFDLLSKLNDYEFNVVISSLTEKEIEKIESVVNGNGHVESTGWGHNLWIPSRVMGRGVWDTGEGILDIGNAVVSSVWHYSNSRANGNQRPLMNSEMAHIYAGSEAAYNVLKEGNVPYASNYVRCFGEGEKGSCFMLGFEVSLTVAGGPIAARITSLLGRVGNQLLARFITRNGDEIVSTLNREMAEQALRNVDGSKIDFDSLGSEFIDDGTRMLDQPWSGADAQRRNLLQELYGGIQGRARILELSVEPGESVLKIKEGIGGHRLERVLGRELSRSTIKEYDFYDDVYHRIDLKGPLRSEDGSPMPIINPDGSIPDVTVKNFGDSIFKELISQGSDTVVIDTLDLSLKQIDDLKRYVNDALLKANAVDSQLAGNKPIIFLIDK